ncbi:MAG: PadR family transcriptional regulator, partial [Candidatus Aenigmarchaeota archaeon]|nr:PadR family transcriptional regulator [Candidatus Aenigmarchaeota archaeon]
MRTLKYAILGLLNRKPMTGYDLSKEFSYQLGNFWSANHSQIY